VDSCPGFVGGLADFRPNARVGMTKAVTLVFLTTNGAGRLLLKTLKLETSENYG
jgi:hypothetical protein